MESIGVADDKENFHSNIFLQDNDDDDDDDDEEETPAVVKLKDRRLQAKNRRRRRSSARFLKLDDEEEEPPLSSANLGEVYQNAIRMNAENKINASNSWNLNLIDHLDRFVSTSEKKEAVANLQHQQQDGVNFTKASCTLDASVKIYSYRVDDVHLTSYKVLANLNRTETGSSNNKKNKEKHQDSKDATTTNHRSERRKTTETETLEQNLANINMAKLDEAFDIDPLFHKMSKTFDEGGAKGLLLANLGVSMQGCNIVFDSTLENDHEDEEEEKTPDPDKTMELTNVTSLVNKLESSLGGQPIHLLPLVPQLATLRDEYAHLHQEGYVDKSTPSTRRYAAPQEDELEADRSIHLEAIERSRASQADLGRSLMAQDDHSTLDDGPIDFGAGNDFGDDDDNDTDNLIGSTFVHDGDHRFSSSSFQTSFEASQPPPPSQATLLLDAIASGRITGSQSNYEFFNQQALDKIQGNMWAGAAHWKKMPQPKRKTTTIATTKKGKGKKKTTKATTLLSTLNLREPVANLEDLLRKPPKKGRKGVDPLQLSKAVQTKHAKNDNLLPLDIGLEVGALSTLFLRPKTILLTGSEDAGVANAKQVGFSGVDTWNDRISLGDDNDGPGFDFGGNDDDDQDSLVPELEGVRKVEKVQVGYATVAKKVDVKRLKLDLWEELERKFADEKDHPDEEAMDDSETEEEDAPIAPKSTTAAPGPLSFQDTVKQMQGTQKQSDVTLPFYFICLLHLANEKGLALESTGLEDFIIRTS